MAGYSIGTCFYVIEDMLDVAASMADISKVGRIYLRCMLAAGRRLPLVTPDDIPATTFKAESKPTYSGEQFYGTRFPHTLHLRYDDIPLGIG
jgi:hypothetical protein